LQPSVWTAAFVKAKTNFQRSQIDFDHRDLDLSGLIAYLYLKEKDLINLTGLPVGSNRVLIFALCCVNFRSKKPSED